MAWLLTEPVAAMIGLIRKQPEAITVSSSRERRDLTRGLKRFIVLSVVMMSFIPDADLIRRLIRECRTIH
jgi:hypothetical protein